MALTSLSTAFGQSTMQSYGDDDLQAQLAAEREANHANVQRITNVMNVTVDMLKVGEM